MESLVEIDPIRYEMFVHRLMNIAEEGRIALQKVCASPIVVQGGECMASFYEADGTTVLSASGHLRFSAGCEDAVLKDDLYLAVMRTFYRRIEERGRTRNPAG